MTDRNSPADSVDQLLAGWGDMLMIEDVMKILAVSRTAVNARLDTDDDPIPSYRIGKFIRIQKSDLREWMLRHRRG